MSELNFSIMDNNADFQQKTKQLREAIDGLETDFTNPSQWMFFIRCF